ncbi:MAG: hypothetical protein ACK5QT_11135 [Oligoflexia bacterium]
MPGRILRSAKQAKLLGILFHVAIGMVLSPASSVHKIGKKSPIPSDVTTIYVVGLTFYTQSMQRVFTVTATLTLSLFLNSGCAILFGNVDPIERPAHQNAALRPEIPVPGPQWRRVLTEPQAGQDSPDAVFKNLETGSTLSMTSGCRSDLKPTNPAASRRELARVAATMTGSLDRMTRRKQLDTTLDGVPALESTVYGILEQNRVVIRTRVARKGDCIFDLTLVSLERFFDAEAAALEEWSSLIRLP